MSKKKPTEAIGVNLIGKWQTENDDVHQLTCQLFNDPVYLLYTKAMAGIGHDQPLSTNKTLVDLRASITLLGGLISKSYENRQEQLRADFYADEQRISAFPQPVVSFARSKIPRDATALNAAEQTLLFQVKILSNETNNFEAAARLYIARASHDRAKLDDYERAYASWKNTVEGYSYSLQTSLEEGARENPTTGYYHRFCSEVLLPHIVALSQQIEGTIIKDHQASARKPVVMKQPLTLVHSAALEGCASHHGATTPNLRVVSKGNGPVQAR